jgi:hypothetical protein
MLNQLRCALDILALGSYGILPDDLPSIVAMSRGGSMKHNPITLTDDELTSILLRVMDGEAEERAPP